MILTGKEIEAQVNNDNNIEIYPFNKKNINPNSYNYRIGNTIMKLPKTYENDKEILEEIPPEGYLLKPNNVYLANTFEVIGSKKYVTSLIGKSSIGRLGLFLQISADLGNLGDPHKWTLELVCTQPIIIYPNMIIGQVSFWKPEGDISLYKGNYNKFNSAKFGLYGGNI